MRFFLLSAKKSHVIYAKIAYYLTIPALISINMREHLLSSNLLLLFTLIKMKVQKSLLPISFIENNEVSHTSGNKNSKNLICVLWSVDNMHDYLDRSIIQINYVMQREQSPNCMQSE